MHNKDYTFPINENAAANAQSYCELCGQIKHDADATHLPNVSASEAICELAQLFRVAPIAVEIILTRITDPHLSLLQIGKQIKRDKKAIVGNARKVAELMPDLARMLAQDSPRVVAQSKRRAFEKLARTNKKETGLPCKLQRAFWLN